MENVKQIKTENDKINSCIHQSFNNYQSLTNIPYYMLSSHDYF